MGQPEIEALEAKLARIEANFKNLMALSLEMIGCVSEETQHAISYTVGTLSRTKTLLSREIRTLKEAHDWPSGR